MRFAAASCNYKYDVTQVVSRKTEIKGVATYKERSGQVLCYSYFDDEYQRPSSTMRMTKDDAFLIAVAIAKLPSVP